MSQSAVASWRPLRAIDRRLLTDARLQAHNAVQWLARSARAYISPMPDDAHTSLEWDDKSGAFVTRPLRDGSELSLNIPSLTLSLRHNGSILPFSLHRRTDAEVRDWLGAQLQMRGFDAAALDQPAPYTVPAHTPMNDASYDAVDRADALSELAAWFANAQYSLEPIRARSIASKLDASDVRCWPHHFDLATLISFAGRNGETGYVGAGLSPGDGYYDEPYFYVSVYPRPDPAALPPLPEPSHWHTHEFTAAIIPAHSILALNDRQAVTDRLLTVAVGHAVGLLL